MFITDAYGRPFRSIRLLVTNECNYNCFFCHMEGSPAGRPFRIGEDPPSMTPLDYEILAEAAVSLGVRGFKITGGEPLARSDIVEVVSAVSSPDRSLDISMTTNGFYLASLAPSLASAGLKRVNVSLHSLRREVYRKITGVDGLDRVLEGLRVAVDMGLKVKINTLVLRGINETEVWSIAELASKLGATLQLIELIPVGRGSSLDKFAFKLSVIEEELLKRGAERELRDLHYRPVYRLPNGVTVEIVSSPSNPVFCAGCDRVRVDPHGYVSPCINWSGRRVNILDAIRSAKTREEAVAATRLKLLEAVWLRRPGYMFTLAERRAVAREGRSLTRLSLPSRAKDLEKLGVSESSLLED
ncbi:MAG: GTP 3',8-cyclase MoaA [Acidilobaceae archaeon]